MGQLHRMESQDLFSDFLSVKPESQNAKTQDISLLEEMKQGESPNAENQDISLLEEMKQSESQNIENQDISLLEEIKQSLLTEQKLLEEERRKFQMEKENFRIHQQTEEQRLKRESELFEMKWRILEGELFQLAKEKQEVAAEKEACRRIKAENQRYSYMTPKVIRGEMFFSGVDSELGMKKRYKDLIKIFHPDNRDGDTHTLQVINKEYDEMKKQFYV